MSARAPQGFRSHGQYRSVGSWQQVTPGAGIILMAMRWADPHKFCIVQRLNVNVQVTGAITPQRIDPLLLTVQRQYTVAESVNVASFLPSGVSGRSFTGFAPPSLAQLVSANGVAGISG